MMAQPPGCASQLEKGLNRCTSPAHSTHLPPETLSAWNIPGGGLALGSYPPAIVDGGHTSVKAVQDEPFGPPLAVETFRAEQEAITLANHRLRLARAVRKDDGARAQRGRGSPAGHRVD